MPLFVYITDENGYNTGHADGNKHLEIELHVDHERVGRVILDYQGKRAYTVRYEKNDGTRSRFIDSNGTVLPSGDGRENKDNEHRDGLCTDGCPHRIDPYTGECTGEDCYK